MMPTTTFRRARAGMPCALIWAALSLVTTAHAQSTTTPPPPAAGHDAAAHGSSPAAAAAMTDGEIRKVDKSAGTLTIRHGEIPSLDMGPMTMVFRAQDPSMLDRVKAGDKVRFRAAAPNGELTVTAIEPRP